MRQKLTLTAAIMMVLLSCLFPGGSLFAQTRTIVGRISTPDGSPVQGATIQEKGVANTTVSDAAGNYAIRLTNENAVLVVTYIGFGTQELRIGRDARLN